MTDKNLVPVAEPDAESPERRAARRAKREQRQRALARRAQQAAEAVDATPKPVAHAASVALDPNDFVLPPRVHVERATSGLGRFLKLSFAVLVLLPTALVGLFYAFVASDQYATESAFAVRGNSSSSASTDFGSLFGVGSGVGTPESADSYIVQQYVHSREMVERLIADANFLEIYSRPSVDPYYRLDPEATIEDVVDYWKMMSSVLYDAETGIITLLVRAFRPQDAAAVTGIVLDRSEALVNELSLRAREDSVRTAESEVRIAEERFAVARTALAEYRGDEQELDPTATALSKQEVVGSLEAQLAQLESMLTSLRATMSEDAPRVVYVRNQIEALRAQVAAERFRVAQAETGDERPVLTERLSRYEELLAEREFAEKSYLSRLATLEAARVEALKQQRYLAVFVRGAAPEEADYPEGLRWTLIVFGALLLGWGVLALVSAAIRDRTS